MAKPADPDSTFPVACRHCAQPLHGKVRFCPYCGGEEASLRTDIGTDIGMASPAVELEQRAPAPAPVLAEALAQLEPEATAVPQRERRQKMDLPSFLGAPKRPREAEDTGSGALLGPAAFEWPDGLPAVITVEARTPKPRLGALLVKPVAIGTALVLSVLALVLGPLQAGRRGEPERAPEPTTAKVEPAPSAPAELPPPASAAAATAAAAAAAAAAAVTVPPVAEAAAALLPAAPPPPAIPVVQEPKANACGGALAALALCPPDDAGQAAPR